MVKTLPLSPSPTTFRRSPDDFDPMMSHVSATVLTAVLSISTISVPELELCALGGRVRVHADHEQIRERRHRSPGEDVPADVAGAAVCREVPPERLGAVDRDCAVLVLPPALAGRGERVEADHLAAIVEQRTARVARAQRRLVLDQCRVLGQRVADRGRRDARGDGAVGGLEPPLVRVGLERAGIAEHGDPVTRPHAGGAAQFGLLEPRGLGAHLEHGQVLTRRPPADHGVHLVCRRSP